MSVFFSFFNFYLLDTEISKKVGFLRSFRKDCTQLTYNPTIRLQTQQLFVSFVYHFGGVNSPTIYKFSLNFQLLPPFPPNPLQPSTHQKLTTAPTVAIITVLIISPASNIATTLNIVPDTVPMIVVLSFVYSIISNFYN